jgi:hypothetical protein
MVWWTDLGLGRSQVEIVGRDMMLVTAGGGAEEEAMLNEDSLLCLVEDVDEACDALGDNAVSVGGPFSWAIIN